ncbi:MAG: hypothetical protein K9M15_02630 [Candidatus Marinimicrobia bacterium]|nr:hypothetical protein [Candidatus Neomarinimicrobiota bacterium]
MLRVGDVSGVAVLALPLAYSIGMILNFILLFGFFQKDFGGMYSRIKKSFFQVLVSSVFLGFIAYYLLSFFGKIFDLDTFLGVLMQGLFAGVLSLFVGFIFLGLLRNTELREITLFVRKKFSKSETGKIIAKPEPEELP